MSELNECYELDYLVFSASKSITEEALVWELELYDIYKRMMFEKFDNYIERSLLKKDGK